MSVPWWCRAGQNGVTPVHHPDWFNYRYFKPITISPSKAEQDARKELFDSWLNPDPIDATKIVTEDRETALMDPCAAYARDAASGRAGL